MSFRIRFLLRMLCWFFQTPLDLTREFRGDYRIWPTEAELRLVEYYRYGYLLVLERFRAVFATGLWKLLVKRRWSAVTGAQIYKVKRPLRRGQRFTITTSPLSWDDKWVYFEQRIESSGKLVCAAVSSVMFLAKDRKIPPTELVQLMGWSLVSPPLSTAVQRFQEAERTLTE